MPKLIAIVEDETAIRENYSDALTRLGYRVQGYAHRHSAMSDFERRLPDLAILDIGLGEEMDGGFELCRELRNLSSTLPILFLTARDSDFDTVAGLRLGADDYVTKDVSLPHLSARIAALFRRVESQQQIGAASRRLEQGALRLDPDQLMAHWREQPVELTVTEFWILHALVKHPGHVKSRAQLMDAANLLVDEASITTHIKRIRHKFQQLETNFDRIEAIYGMGYRWHPNEV